MPRLTTRNIGGVPFGDVPNAALNAKYRASDIVCLQEAFRFGCRPRVLSAGFSHVQHFFPRMSLFGSGLMTAAKRPFRRVIAKAYPRLRPWSLSSWRSMISKADLFVAKGFLGVDFEGVWIFQTHMNAGGTRPDWEQRAIEMHCLADHLPTRGPLIICGDFNLDAFDPFQRPRVYEDKKILDSLMRRARVHIEAWDNVDGMLVRDVPSEFTASVGPRDGLSGHRPLTVEW